MFFSYLKIKKIFHSTLKKAYLISMAFLSAFLLSYCGLKVGEAPYRSQVFKVKSGNYNCLSDVNTKVFNYFQGNLSLKEVDEFVDCVQYALKSYQKYVDGDQEGIYKPEEVRFFLETFFLKNLKIHDSFLKELMGVKKVIVGGEKNKITISDLTKIRKFLDLVRIEAKKIHPYLVILNQNNYKRIQFKSENIETLERAIQTMSESVKNLAKFIEKNNEAYRFNQFQGFIKEFRKFMSWKAELSDGNSLKSWMRYIRIFKEVSSGGSSQQIEPDKWVTFFSNWSDWYGNLLRYKYYFKSQENILEHDKFPQILMIINILNKSLKSSIQAQKNKEISFDQIKEILESLDELNQPLFDLKPDTALNFFKKAIVGHGFARHLYKNNRYSEDFKELKGINLKILNEMNKEILLWAHLQCHINQISDSDWEDLQVNSGFYELIDLNYVDIKIKNKSKNINNYKIRLCDQSKLSHFSEYKEGNLKEEFLQLFRLRPLYKREYERAFFMPFKDVINGHIKNTHANLSKLNLIRAVTHMGIRSFGQNRGSFNLEITHSGFKKFYKLSRQLGIELNIMHPSNIGVGSRSFKESKLFTYSARGLDWSKPISSYTEVMDVISTLYSSGNAAESLYHRILKECEAVDKKGVFGLPMVTRNCFEKEFRPLMLDTIVNLPKMKEFLSKESTNDKNWNVIHNELYSLVRREEDPVDYVEYNEISAYLSTLHYVEAMFSRYDKDKSDVLEENELWQFYETMKTFVFNVLNDQLLEGILGKNPKNATKEDLKQVKSKVKEMISEVKAQSYWLKLFDKNISTDSTNELNDSYSQLSKNLFAFLVNNRRKPYAPKRKFILDGTAHGIENDINYLKSFLKTDISILTNVKVNAIDRRDLIQVFTFVARMVSASSKKKIKHSSDRFIEFKEKFKNKDQKYSNLIDLSHRMHFKIKSKCKIEKNDFESQKKCFIKLFPEKVKKEWNKDSLIHKYLKNQKNKRTIKLKLNKIIDSYYHRNPDRFYEHQASNNYKPLVEDLTADLYYIDQEIFKLLDVNYNGKIDWLENEEVEDEFSRFSDYFIKSDEMKTAHLNDYSTQDALIRVLNEKDIKSRKSIMGVANNLFFGDNDFNKSGHIDVLDIMYLLEYFWN